MPFLDDELAQHAFDNINHTIMHAHVLQPPDYKKYYFLYVVASLTAIGMVLVNEENNDQEHVMYYLSKSLLDSKT